MTVVSAARVPIFEPLRGNGISVAKLIATPEKWTQGARWRDAAGKEIEDYPLRSNPPAMFDLMGAIDWLYTTRLKEECELRIMKVLGLREPGKITRWQDEPGRTHAEILVLVQKAGI